MAEASRVRERFLQGLTGLVLVGVVVVQYLIVRTGEDPYRIPKELWVRAEAIAIAALLILGLLWGWLDRRVFVRERTLFALAGAVVVWTGVTTILSSYPAMSVWSLCYVTSLAVIFVATFIAALRRSLLFADIALVAVVPNAIACMLSEFGIWNPLMTKKEMLESGEWPHLYAGGFLGNPNDIGMLLVGPALATLILCALIPRRRLWYGALAIPILAGLLTTQSAAAIGAFVVALLVIAFRASRKAAAVAVGGVLLIVACVVFFSSAVQRKVASVIQLARSDHVSAYDVDRALSNRVLPFLVAGRMGLDHPVFGVGPGRFPWHFYAYKLAFEKRHPTLRQAATNFLSWAEAHNDHLQTIATTGFPGYALYVTAIVMLARRSRRRSVDGDELQRFASHFALPFAVTFAVLTLAQFPMELAAPAVMLLYWAAVSMAWTSDATA
ncbi:MAG TPA: O-antigen ligase family protein [Thermoanaerobaculia bacterium]|nr:O-antigen ligase family protein [Thermoanaerobaculia bacterium]